MTSNLKLWCAFAEANAELLPLKYPTTSLHRQGFDTGAGELVGMKSIETDITTSKPTVSKQVKDEGND